MTGLKFGRREKIVSIFIISTVLIIITTVILMGQFNKWFSDKIVYHTEFKSRGDLKVGSTIVFKQLEEPIGFVSGMEFQNKNNKIRVSLKIEKKYEDKIREDSIAYLAKSGFAGLAGSTNIQVSIGTERYPKVGAGRFLPSHDSAEGRVILSDKRLTVGHDIETNMRIISANIAYMTDPSGPLMQSLYNLEAITRQLNEGETVPKILTLIDDVEVSTRKSLKDVNNITANLDKLMSSNVNRVDKLVESLTTQLGMIIIEVGNTSKSILGKISKNLDPVLKDTSQAMTKVLKDLIGSVNVMVGSLENSVTASVRDIREVIQNVKTITRRVNVMLSKIEKLSIFEGQRTRKPTLIDEMEREDN